MLRELTTYDCPLCRTKFESFLDIQILKYDGCNITCSNCGGFLTIREGKLVSEPKLQDNAPYDLKIEELQKCLGRFTADSKRYRFLRDNKFLDAWWSLSGPKDRPRNIDADIDSAMKEGFSEPPNDIKKLVKRVAELEKILKELSDSFEYEKDSQLLKFGDTVNISCSLDRLLEIQEVLRCWSKSDG